MTTVGILGGGQLGRMLALAGHPLGLRFHLLDPAANAPAGSVGHHILANYEEEDLLRFAADIDVVTYEFENVPSTAATFLAERIPVYPPPRALEVAQDRLEEKLFLQSLDIPTADFEAIDHRWQSVLAALEHLALPVVMKQRRLGYDGGGQRVLRTMAEVEAAWSAFGFRPALLERLIRFARELSLIAVRGRDGQVRYYPLTENRHLDGILRCSLAPARDLAPGLQAEAEEYAARILRALDYVGVLVVEFFEQDQRLLVNELAPRVHNSGHWTIEGAVTSQFENHLRAILGLPLGRTSPVGQSAMVNIIGTLPDPAPILRLPDTHLHLYGKSERPGRKLGHVTARVPDPRHLEELVQCLLELIAPDNSNDNSRRTDAIAARSNMRT